MATAAEETAIAHEAQSALPADIRGRIEQAVARARMLEQMVGRVLQEGVDYGRIPGTPKPTLYQPGAQQLCFVFGFSQHLEVMSEKVDFGADPPFISYTVRCRLIQRDSGEVMAEGVGACNSMEARYRYRSEWQGDGRDRRKVRTLNSEIADLQNTILKMASKRATVAATLAATAASRLFTQDLEDLRPAADEYDAAPRAPQREAPTRGAAQKPAKGGRAASEPQRKKIYALAHHVGATDAQMKALLTQRYGVEGSKDLSSEQASDMIGVLEQVEQGVLSLDELIALSAPPEESTPDRHSELRALWIAAGAAPAEADASVARARESDAAYADELALAQRARTEVPF